MKNIITEEEDRKFIHAANNHLFIMKGTISIIKRKLSKQIEDPQEYIERLDKIEAAVDKLTEMFVERRSIYVPPEK